MRILSWLAGRRAWAAVAAIIGLLLLNFLFTAHYVNSTQARFAQQQAAQQAATAKAARKAAGAQLAAARQECRALEGLDAAHQGIVFSPATRAGTAELYVLRLVGHIHDVYVHSGCSGILRGVPPGTGTGKSLWSPSPSSSPRSA